MSTKQTIFRVAKNRENPYVMVDKQFVERATLSFRAKGVLVYLLSKPDHWKVNVKNIMAHSRDGRDAVYSALKELVEHGYIQRVCHRTKGKVQQYEYSVNEQVSSEMRTPTASSSVSESQETEVVEEPETEKPEMVLPEVVKAEATPLVPDASCDTAHPVEPYPETPYPETPYPANPTQGSKDFRKKEKNKEIPHSRRACSTILELWQEIFSSELPEQEYDAFLKVCSRTTLVRNLCLIHEHHSVSSIVRPFPFVMKCITGGGYKVPKKAPSYVSGEYEQKKSKPLPKAVQEQRSGVYVPRYTPEELEQKKAEIEAKIKKMYEDHPLPGERVVPEDGVL